MFLCYHKHLTSFGIYVKQPPCLNPIFDYNLIIVEEDVRFFSSKWDKSSLKWYICAKISSLQWCNLHTSISLIHGFSYWKKHFCDIYKVKLSHKRPIRFVIRKLWALWQHNMFIVQKTKCVKIHYSSTLPTIPSFPKYKQYDLIMALALYQIITFKSILLLKCNMINLPEHITNNVIHYNHLLMYRNFSIVSHSIIDFAC